MYMGRANRLGDLNSKTATAEYLPTTLFKVDIVQKQCTTKTTVWQQFYKVSPIHFSPVKPTLVPWNTQQNTFHYRNSDRRCKSWKHLPHLSKRGIVYIPLTVQEKYYNTLNAPKMLYHVSCQYRHVPPTPSRLLSTTVLSQTTIQCKSCRKLESPQERTRKTANSDDSRTVFLRK